MAKRSKGKRRMIVAVAAAAVIAVCSVKMGRELRGGNAGGGRRARRTSRYGQRWRDLPGGQPAQRRSDSGTVLEWRVRARPVYAPPDYPALGAALPSASGPQGPGGKGLTKVLPAEPAVEVAVEVVLESSGREPVAIWPLAESLEIRMADSVDGPFALCGAVFRRDLDRFPARSASGRGLGPRSNRAFFTYRAFVLDRGSPPGRERFYRARFMDASGAVLAESGVCSARALSVPVPTVSVTNKGIATVAWTGLTPEGGTGLTGAAFIVSLTSPGVIVAYDLILTPQTVLTRQPIRGGSFEIPVRLAPSRLPQQIVFALTGRAEATGWSSTTGSVTRERSVAACVCFAPKVKKRTAAKAGHAVVSFVPSLRSFPHNGSVAADRTYFIRLRPDPTWQILDVLRKGQFSALPASVFPVRKPGGKPETLWELVPGAGERITYTVRMRTGTTGSDVPVEASLLSPVRLRGVRAMAGNGRVRLSWESYAWDPKDWVSGPEIVVHRTQANGASTQYSQITNQTPLAEVYRCPADARGWIDQSVKNGALYLYAITVEGLTHGRAFAADSGPYDVLLPVRLRAGEKRLSRYPLVVAQPGPPVPLKVAVTIREAALDKRLLNFAQTNLKQVLGVRKWVRLVERTGADKLLDENSLGAFSQPRHGGADSATAPAVADVVVRCVVRRFAGSKRIDAWLIDFRSSWRERIVSMPAEPMVLGDFSARVVSGLKEYFPDWRERFSAGSVSGGRVPRKICVLGLTPADAAAGGELPAGAVNDLVCQALAENERWILVEREQLREALGELGSMGVVDGPSALRLGKLLRADVVLIGSYERKQGTTTLAGMLLEVESGLQLGSVAARGQGEDLRRLAAELAEKLAALASAGESSGPSLLRRLEAAASVRSSDRLANAKRTAFITAGDSDALETMGQEYEGNGDFEQAANSYRLAITAKGAGGVPSTFLHEAADRCLRKLDRAAERVTLWQDALRRCVASPRAAAITATWLAEALSDAGRTEEARQVLNKHPPVESGYKTNALHEKLGLEPDPLRRYVEAEWRVKPTVRGNRRWFEGKLLGPNYAATIRLLEATSGEQRVPALRAIALRLKALRPYQCLRAAGELRDMHRVDVVTAGAALAAAAATNNDAGCRDWLAELMSRRADTLECLKAFAGAAKELFRFGRREAAEQLASSALTLAVESPAASAQRALIKRLLAGKGAGAGKTPRGADSGPVVDDAVREYVARDGGRSVDGDVCVLTERGVLARLRLPDLSVVWTTDLGFRRPFPMLERGDTGRRVHLRTLNNTIWPAGGLIFVPNIPDGVMYAIDAASGRLRWTYTAWTGISPAVVRVDLGCVCASDGFGNLLMLDLTKGTLMRRLAGPAEREAEFRELLPDLRAVVAIDRNGTGHRTEWLEYRPSYQVLSQRAMDSMRGAMRVMPAALAGTHRFNIADLSMRMNPVRKAGGRLPKNIRKIVDPGKSEEGKLWALAACTGARDARAFVPELRQLVGDETSSGRIRASALSSLATIDPDAALPVIEGILAEQGHALRASAIDVLRGNMTRIGAHGQAAMRTDVSSNVINRLAGLSRAKDSEVRHAAMVALVNCLGKEARPFVGEILDNEDDPDRALVAWRLARDGDRSVLPIVKRYVRRDQPVKLQVSLLRVLSQLGDQEAMDKLAGLLDLDAEVEWAKKVARRGANAADQTRAEKVLRTIRDYLPEPRFVPLIEQLLPFLDVRRRATACQTLAGIDDPRTIPLLIGLLPREDTHPSSAVATFEGGRNGEPPDRTGLEAATALEKITGHGWGESGARWRNWHRTMQGHGDGKQ